MKMTVRIFALLLAALSIASAVIPASAADVTEIFCTPDRTEVEPGESITVTVSSEGTAAFRACGFLPAFDPAVFRLTGGEILVPDAALSDVDLEQKLLCAAWERDIPHGALLRFTLQVLPDAAEGAHPVGGKASLVKNGAAVPVNVTETAVTVTAGWDCPYTDITPADPYYRAVRFVTENALFIGTGGGKFSPDMTMTRGMFVTVLGRLADAEPDASGAAVFSDVAEDAWYAPYVGWAAEHGVVRGCGDGTFAPEDTVTAEQAVQILKNYAEALGADTVSDGDLTAWKYGTQASGWAEEALRWGFAAGVCRAEEMPSPVSPAPRSLAAQLLWRFVPMMDAAEQR